MANSSTKNKKVSTKNNTKTKVVKKATTNFNKTKKNKKEVIEEKPSTKKEVKITSSKQKINNFNIWKISYIIFCAVVVFISFTIIDFSISQRYKAAPTFAIKKVNKEKQSTIYYGLFYKAYKCNNQKEYTFLNYGTEDSTCSIVLVYNNDIYTNPYSVEMTREEIGTIYKYYSENINSYKTREEFEKDYAKAEEFSKNWWVTENISIETSLGEANVAIFSKLEEVDGNYKWVTQYDNNDYKKCVLKSEDGTFLFSDYIDGECYEKWSNIKLSSNFCKLIKDDNSLIKTAVTISKMCD